MKLSSKTKKDEGTWLHPDKEEHPEVRIRVIRPTPGELRRLREQSKVPRFSGKMTVFDHSNIEYHRNLLVHCVIEIAGIDADDGSPVPCSEENLVEIDDSWIEFSACWQEFVNTGSMAAAVQDQVVRGNSSGGQNSISPSTITTPSPSAGSAPEPHSKPPASVPIQPEAASAQ